MRDAEVSLAARLEAHHWWFVGKRLLLDALLRDVASPGRLLDLGCGSGGLLRQWSGRASCFGMDRSAVALRAARAQGLDALVQADLGAPPFRSGAFDTILLCDVIEHLDDDLHALREAARLAGPAARVLVLVPAWRFLWSSHDETFGHRRRYSARELLRVVRGAGLVPERTTYTNFFVFPIAALWRPLSRLWRGRGAGGHDFAPLPGWLNAALVAVYRIEAALLRRLDLPFGVSLVCLARPAIDRAPRERTG